MTYEEFKKFLQELKIPPITYSGYFIHYKRNKFIDDELVNISFIWVNNKISLN